MSMPDAVALYHTLHCTLINTFVVASSESDNTNTYTILLILPLELSPRELGQTFL